MSVTPIIIHNVNSIYNALCILANKTNVVNFKLSATTSSEQRHEHSKCYDNRD